MDCFTCLTTAAVLIPILVYNIYFSNRPKKLQHPHLKLVETRDVQSTEFDIVAVQGLGATYPYTWMKRSKDGEMKFWLKDFLAHEFPTARILVFLYSSRWIHGADHIKMKQHGTSLLAALRKDREKQYIEGHRPLVFIGHSFGGIVIKEALRNAKNSKSHLDVNLLKDTCGILFLGTPHRGTLYADAAFIVSSFYKLFAWSYGGLLRALRSNSEALSGLADDFNHLLPSHVWENCVICFYETSSRFFGLVVDEQSASLDRTERVPLLEDHMGMNKFADREGSYREVAARLSRIRDFMFSGKSTFYPERAMLAQEISQLRFQDELQRIGDKFSPGAGDWLLDNDTYKTWAESECRILWLLGDPGIGKTFLSGHIIKEDLRRRHDMQPHFMAAVVFIFCDHTRPDSTNQLLRSLLGQLVEQLPISTEVIEQRKRLASLKVTEVIDLMKSQISRANVYIVIDALDECTGPRDLVQALRELMAGTVRVLITSRKHLHFDFLCNDLDLRLEARRNDRSVQQFIRQQLLTENYQNLSIRLEDMKAANGKSLREEMISIVARQAHGIFLIATLHLQTLRLVERSNLEDTLYNLSYELDEAYEQYLGRVLRNNLARRVLAWIAFACRPLTVLELQCALAIKWDRQDIPRYLEPPALIMQCCAGLITRRTDQIVLVHETTYGNVQRIIRKSGQYPQPVDLALLCLKYLSFQHDDFLSYAGKYWGVHAEDNVEAKDVPRFKPMLQNTDIVVARTREALQKSNGDCPWNASGQSLIHVTCWFGLHQFVVPGDVALKDSNEWTPVFYACIAGRSMTVEHLVKYGASLGLVDNWGRTPLFYAATWDHYHVVELLLDKGADPDSPDEDGRTLLWYAAGHYRRNLVKLLLDNGANPNSPDKDGRTLLFYAVQQNRPNFVKLLLENGADPNSPDKDGRHLLWYAAARDRPDVMKLLLDNGANLNSPDKDGRTPLSHAAAWDRPHVVKLLLDHGVDPNIQDSQGRTPLWHAARGSTDVLRLLLDCGADPNSPDSQGRRPLSYAAARGDAYIVRLLLDRRADPNFRDSQGRTPLSYAPTWGNADAVKLLLDKGADPNPSDNDGRTPLSYAAAWDRRHILELFLERRAEPRYPDKDGGTIPFSASASDHLYVVQLLLDKGADPNSPDKDGRTPLSYVAEQGNADVVKILLHKGADSRSQDKEGRMPLLYAAKQGNADAMKLLGKGVDRDKDGQTLLT